MRHLLALLITFVYFNSNAQYTDTVVKYYNVDWEEVPHTSEELAYFGIYRKAVDGTWHGKDYYAFTRKLQMVGSFSDDSMKVAVGQCVRYHSNGIIESKGRYLKGKQVGYWVGYHRNGVMSDSSYYELNGMPYCKSYSWNEEGRLIFYGDFDIKGDGSGYETYYYDDGSIMAYGKSVAGHLPDSTWTFYHNNGQLSFVQNCDSGKVLNYKCYNEDGSIKTSCDTGYVLNNPTYNIADYFYEKLEYLIHEIGKENIREGLWLVHIRFFITSKGKLKLQVIQGGYKELNAFIERMYDNTPLIKPLTYKNTPVLDYSDIVIPIEISDLSYYK